MPSRASRGGKRADFVQKALRAAEEATGEVLKPAEGKNPQAQVAACAQKVRTLATLAHVRSRRSRQIRFRDKMHRTLINA